VLAGRGARRHALGMFVVTEADAAAIRAIFHQEGELSAVIELRRRFPGITDNAKARECARSIAGWTPLPVQPSPVTRLRPRKLARLLEPREPRRQPLLLPRPDCPGRAPPAAAGASSQRSGASNRAEQARQLGSISRPCAFANARS
jgi:hypothetical protein